MYKKHILAPFSYDHVNQAVYALKNGELVIFPTDTVYGIAAHAEYNSSVNILYRIKDRSINKSFIVHVGSIEVAKKYAVFSDEALLLARHFWPGPLTLILPIKEKDNVVSPLITKGHKTIAIRMPHGFCLEVLKKCSFGVAMPSVNISGNISPTSFEDIDSIFFSSVKYFFNSGDCNIGLESTIIDLTVRPFQIIRSGPILLEDIIAITSCDCVYDNSLYLLNSPMKTSRPVRLNAMYPLEHEAWLGFGSIPSCTLNLSKNNLLEEAAKNLYHMLHVLDNVPDKKGICVSPIPYYGIGIAINDRLYRSQFS